MSLQHAFISSSSPRFFACSAADNGKFISASSDKSLLLWDVASGKTIRKFRAHAGAINAVKLNEEATMAVSASYDASVKCWDLRSHERDPIQVMNEAKDRY